MKALSKAKYTGEFKAEAVKLVVEQKLSIAETSKRLGLPENTLGTWVRQTRQGRFGTSVPAVSDLTMEVFRLRKALAQAQMERDILKKAAAYFAKESQRGTRT